MPLTEEQVKLLSGLSENEARRKILKEGYNELPSSRKKTLLGTIWEVMKEPMFLLLVACGVLYLFLGDIQEAIMLLGFVLVIIGITVYQEGKTEKALDALKDLSSPRALVIREGKRRRIAGREVVRGDYIILCEGDRVPADGILIWGINLGIDESLLTGESIAVRKLPGEEKLKLQPPGGDNSPYIYSGTLVVQGQGIALIKETGSATEMGKIGKALQEVENEPTILQRETGRIVKAIFIIALILCSLVIIVYSLTKKDLIGGILSGITLAMAMLPEEFPVVLTVFLAIGAWRISKKNVLTRKVSAVETLGATSVLCVDKTGTLTQNKMSIQQLFTNSSFYDVHQNTKRSLPEEFHQLVEYGILASKRDPFDPMEKALNNLGYEKLNGTEHIHEQWKLVQEYPLSRELLALSHVWISPDGNDYCIAAKGAPEAIADLCHLSAVETANLEKSIQKMATVGLRVLGVAKSSFTRQQTLPEIQHAFQFKFLGLIGLADPIREMVPRAVKECHNAGIRVIMITGDYPVTACNIAKQIGLFNPDSYITGTDLTAMSNAELKEKIRHVNIFARVVPEQKLLIVNALKENKEIVAMTGDGVNDAPALKASHIGIAMGERGTDVAREASNLVLLNDDFSSIVAGVKMGRRIFDNLKKAMAYIISVHIPIAGLSLIPILFQWKELILFPVHIVFLELIIDPACSIVFESEAAEQDIMRKQPRQQTEKLFSGKPLIFSVLQGSISLIVVLVVYQLALTAGQSMPEARTLSFITLIISNLCLILTNRSWQRTIIESVKVKNNALLWVLGSAMLFLALAVYIPVIRNLFHFSSLHFLDIALSICAGITSVLWFEIVKLISRRKKK